MAVLAASLVIKLVGFLIKTVVANEYGLAVSDAFSVVNGTVLGTAFALGENCLGPAFMPVFAGAREKDGEARAWRYASVLFNLQFLILLAIIAALMLFPAQIVALFTQWDTDAAAGNAAAAVRRDLAEAMLPYLAPALLGMSLASLTYWVLVAYKRFFFAAFGDALLRLSVLGGAAVGALLGVAGGPGAWRYIVVGAVAGGTLKLLLHLVVLGRERLRMYRPSLDLKDVHLRAFFLLVLPLLVGIFVSQWRDAVVRNAITSVEGLPTLFDMGKGVVDSIGFLIPLSLSIALLPYFCDMEARNDRAQLGRLLTQAIRMLVWLFVPLGIVLAAAAVPTCMTLYRGTIIGPPQAALAGLVLQFYCIQLPFLATEMMLNQAFFSGRRMVAPTAAGIVLSLVASAIAYFAVIQSKVTDGTQILLIVCVTLVSMRLLKCFILVGLLKRTVPVLPLSQTVGYVLRVLVAGGAAAAAALAMRWLYHGPLAFLDQALHGGRVSNLAEAVLIGLAGALVYLALSLLLRMEEPRLCWQWTKEKLRRRGTKAPDGGTAASAEA